MANCGSLNCPSIPPRADEVVSRHSTRCGFSGRRRRCCCCDCCCAQGAEHTPKTPKRPTEHMSATEGKGPGTQLLPAATNSASAPAEAAAAAPRGWASCCPAGLRKRSIQQQHCLTASAQQHSLHLWARGGGEQQRSSHRHVRAKAGYSEYQMPRGLSCVQVAAAV
jgi:hypothetical protein